MDTSVPGTLPPESGAPTAPGFDELEFPKTGLPESGVYEVVPTVALAVADPKLRDSLSVLLQGAGRMAGGDNLVPAAAVVITDAGAGVRRTMTSLRATARKDAGIIVILCPSEPDAEVDAAYETGALLCLRAPVNQHLLLAAIGSAIDLLTAKVHADDLTRQLDVQSHLASLGRVTAGFTHEVSNPLAVLVTNFAMIRDDVESLLQARDLLAVALEHGAPSGVKTRAAERLSRMQSAQDVRGALSDMAVAFERINAVLATVRALSRAEPGTHIQEVHLASVVRDVRRWAALELKGIEVEERIDEPISARADPRLLGQVVLNLVANAAHAACKLPSPRVRLHVYGSTEAAILSVRDNGPGIPDDIQDRIFEPFFTTRRAEGGTGLGLALCHEYVRQMNGHITLWTAPGRGACFRVHLRRGGK